jgi:hypothetical protein
VAELIVGEGLRRQVSVDEAGSNRKNRGGFKKITPIRF